MPTWVAPHSGQSVPVSARHGHGRPHPVTAATPLTGPGNPLLACDLWEHAYYIDFRNLRPKYMETFWALVNWEFVAGNMK